MAVQLLGKDYLKIYLEDHYAGATAGVDLARRSAGANRGTPYGEVLDRIAAEIEKDRDSLRAIMTELGVAPDRLKVAAAWAGEKFGRLKPNGHITSYSPYSRVLEIEGLILGINGKRCLWRALKHVSAQESRLREDELDLLIERAEQQIAELEEQRLKAVSEAVAAAQRR